MWWIFFLGNGDVDGAMLYVLEHTSLSGLVEVKAALEYPGETNNSSPMESNGSSTNSRIN
jgi:hypothetical protein